MYIYACVHGELVSKLYTWINVFPAFPATWSITSPSCRRFFHERNQDQGTRPASSALYLPRKWLGREECHGCCFFVFFPYRLCPKLRRRAHPTPGRCFQMRFLRLGRAKFSSKVCRLVEWAKIRERTRPGMGCVWLRWLLRVIRFDLFESRNFTAAPRSR